MKRLLVAVLPTLLVDAGEKGTYGTGQDGDVTMTFNDDSYLLRGAGKEPINLTLAGHNARLLVDGTISGDYGWKATERTSRSERAAVRPLSMSAMRSSHCRWRK